MTASLYEGDPVKLREAAGTSRTKADALGSHLTHLTLTQDELQTAIRSQGIGDAIYKALGDAVHMGRKLQNTMGQIQDAVEVVASRMEGSDADATSQVNAALGGGGSSKVDTASWA